MADEIKTRITVEGAPEAVQNVQKIADAERQFAQATEETGDRVRRAGDAEQQRTQSIAAMRAELRDLIAADREYRNALESGATAAELSTQGVEHRKARIDELARSIARAEDAEEQLNTETRRSIDAHRQQAQAVDQNAASGGRFSRIMDSVIGSVRGLLSPVAGIAALQQAYAAWRHEIELTNERLRENAELVNRSVEANTNLAFLGTTPEQRDFAAEAAAKAGRDPNEGSRVYADIISRRSQASEEERRAIYEQALETGKTTDAPLQAIADALLTIQKFEPDAQKAQNILFQTIKEAGVSDPAKVSPLLARFLGLDLGGLSVGEKAGFVAAATGLGLGPEESVTGLRNLLLGVSGAGTPQGNEIFDRIGLTRSERNDFKGALVELAQAYESGLIKPEEIEFIAGREGLAVTAALVDENVLRTALAQVESVGRAQNSTSDLTSQEIDLRFKQDPRLETEFETRVSRYTGQVVRQRDTYAQKVQRAREIITTELDNAIASGKVTYGEREAALKRFDELVARGYSPYQAAQAVELNTPTNYLDLNPTIHAPLSEALASELGIEAARNAQGKLDTSRPVGNLTDGVPLSEDELRQQIKKEGESYKSDNAELHASIQTLNGTIDRLATVVEAAGFGTHYNGNVYQGRNDPATRVSALDRLPYNASPKDVAHALVDYHNRYG